MTDTVTVSSVPSDPGMLSVAESCTGSLDEHVATLLPTFGALRISAKAYRQASPLAGLATVSVAVAYEEDA